MKQSIKGILCIAIALFAFSKIEAQVTFKPGIRAGVNLSHFSKGDGYTYYYDSYNPYLVNNNDGDFSSKAGFYVGFIGELHLTKYYTLQPEVLYTNQGSKVRTPSGNEFNLDVSYFVCGYCEQVYIQQF